MSASFPEGSELIRLSLQHQFKPFDCGDQDLNDFLQNDSKKYIKELFAVTYILQSPDKTIAYYSIFNDRIRVIDSHSKGRWKKIAQSNKPQ